MKAYGWFGLALLLVSEFCLFHKIEPVYSWFYCFAWWSYVLLADNLLLKLRGSSLLTKRRHELRIMLPLSVFIWLLFEGYNLILRNWAYSGVPADPRLRWPGYILSFATVLPGIFITSDLLEILCFRTKGGAPASSCEKADRIHSSRPGSFFVLSGLVLSLAPLLYPRIFFPAVWIGPILLFDPLLEKLGLRSLSTAIAEGNRRRPLSLLLGGLACGLMWEFWNFWAGSKWVYTIPFFGRWKIFEMPALGFLGFPPFALECWILYWLLSGVADRLPSRSARFALWLAVTITSCLLFYCLDRFTVIGFASA